VTEAHEAARGLVDGSRGGRGQNYRDLLPHLERRTF
jgi:hypothetical protein